MRTGLLPIYHVAQRIDNCNFANHTLWERAIAEGATYRVAGSVGTQFIAEAASLPMIADESYDFVLASHTIEHTANPLGALEEWYRILRPGGTVVVVAPEGRGTFDHRRPVTTFEHLLADRVAERPESDSTHFSEVLALHDHTRDVASPSVPFGERVARNNELRSIHHHVFDAALVCRAVESVGFGIAAVELLPPYHIVCIGTKAH